MSITKFMTATGSNRELHIKRSNEDHVQIRQFDPEFQTHQAKTFFLNPSEAPALCLAILEAAGWPNEHLATTEILRRLRELDEHVKAVGAEAKERAELEAEALELYDSARSANGRFKIGSFDRLNDAEKTTWLAVARHARAMRAEK